MGKLQDVFLLGQFGNVGFHFFGFSFYLGERGVPNEYGQNN